MSHVAQGRPPGPRGLALAIACGLCASALTGCADGARAYAVDDDAGPAHDASSGAVVFDDAALDTVGGASDLGSVGNYVSDVELAPVGDDAASAPLDASDVGRPLAEDVVVEDDADDTLWTAVDDSEGLVELDGRLEPLDGGSAVDGCVWARDCADDGDACTTAICTLDGACVHEALPCPSEAAPGDGCRIYTCDPGFGCVAQTIPGCVPCDVGLYGTSALADAFCAGVNPCMNGLCDDAVGRCAFSPKDCEDGDACTTDSCLQGEGCQHAAIDGCGPAPGCASDGHCDDGDACSIDTCKPGGDCVHGAVSCDDGDACSVDVCAPTWGCLHGPVSCDDGDACTIDACDTVLGCVAEPRSCNDGDVCTTDACEPALGCTTAAVSCDDGDACTEDACSSAAGCEHAPTDCDDGDPCSMNDCDAETGCEANPTDCDDGDVCTKDACSPLTGQCVHDAVSCDDGDACTTDSCVAPTGCRHDPVVCDPCSSAGAPKGIHCGGGPRPLCAVDASCFTSSCHAVGGCSFVNKCISCTTDLQCADANSCTIDDCVLCGPSGGLPSDCLNTPKLCTDDSPCTLEQCSTATGACVFPPRDCSDADPCTFDSCDPAAGGCQHSPGACDG